MLDEVKSLTEWLHAFSAERRAIRQRYGDNPTIYAYPSEPKAEKKPKSPLRLVRPSTGLARLRHEQRFKRERRIARLMSVQGGKCYLCDVVFGGTIAPTIEHVVPRAAGARSRRNILLACSPCNNAKGDRQPTSAELEILAGINAVMDDEDEAKDNRKRA